MTDAHRGEAKSPLVLPGNTRLYSAVDASSTCSMTSKGQVTIPKALRQQLGLALRPGMLKSQRPPVPVDFDAASLLRL